MTPPPKATVADVERAGGKAIALKGNVADERDVIALFDAAAKAFGSIDGVVNNAGTLSVAAPLADMTLERIRQTIEVNLLGSLLVAREAARRMSKSRGGRGGVLVNLSSAAAKLGGSRRIRRLCRQQGRGRGDEPRTIQGARARKASASMPSGRD